MPYRAYLCLFACGPLMAANLIVGKLAIQWTPPITLALLRWLLALLILLPVYGHTLHPHLPALKARWKTVLLMGATGMTLCGALPYIALTTTTAVNTSFIYATVPLAMVLLAWGMKGERPKPAQGIGLAMAFSGILILMSRGEWQNLLNLHFHRGDLWVLGAVASWAVYSYQQRHTPVPVPAMPLLLASIAAGVLLLLPPAALELLRYTARPGAFPTLPPADAATFLLPWQSWSAAFFLALFPSILSYQCYNHGIRTVGTARAALFLYIVPLWNAALAITLLGERLEWFHYAAIALIMPGIALGSLQRRRPPLPPA